MTAGAAMHAASAASDHGGRRTISADVATTASMNDQGWPITISATRLTAAITASVDARVWRLLAPYAVAEVPQVKRHEHGGRDDRHRDVGGRPGEPDAADLDHGQQRAHREHGAPGQPGDPLVHRRQIATSTRERQQLMTTVTGDRRHRPLAAQPRSRNGSRAMSETQETSMPATDEPPRRPVAPGAASGSASPPSPCPACSS